MLGEIEVDEDAYSPPRDGEDEPPAPPPPERRPTTALYRHFDSAGRLLYVGVSLMALYRTIQHRKGAPWFADVATITIKQFPTRKAALAAEQRAIRNERPLHNQAMNGPAGRFPRRYNHDLPYICHRAPKATPEQLHAKGYRPVIRESSGGRFYIWTKRNPTR